MKNGDILPQVDWPRWMRGLGRNSRSVREFLGLSQEQLARLAGVSQGAISRLEAGRGLATPLLVVVRIGLAFQAALKRVDPTILTDEARRTLGMDFRLGKAGETGEFVDVPLTSDPALQEYLRAYRDLPERQRQTLLSVVRATSAALVNGESLAESKPRAAGR